MEKRTSFIARIVAALALIAAVAAVVMVVSHTTGEDSGSETGKTQTSTAAKKQKAPEPKETPKTYTVKSGDNLTLISEETGVPVSTLRELNPDVDPQILSVGEKLKLR